MLKRLSKLYKGRLFYLILTALVTIAYVVIQYSLKGTVVDLLSVAISITMCTFLTLRVDTLVRKISMSANAVRGLADFKDYPEDVYWKDLSKVLSYRNSCVFGIAFSLYHIVNRMVMHLWSGTPILEVMYLIFTGLINFIAGCAIYMILCFLWLLVKWVQRSTIDGWDLRPTLITELRRLKYSVIFSAILYVSICLSTAGLSIIHIESYFIGYSIFAILLVIVLFFAPEIAIYAKVQKARAKVLLDLDAKIERRYRVFITRRTAAGKTELFNELSQMFQIRDSINKRFKDKNILASVWSFIPVFGAAVVPFIIQFVFEKLL